MAVRKSLISFALLLCVAQVFLAQRYLEIEKRLSGQPPGFVFLPPSSVLRKVSFGYQNVLADLLWVKTIFYFSDQFFGRRHYDHLLPLVNAITDLDPRFEKVYIWAGSASMYNGKQITAKAVDQSTQILKKGLKFYQESIEKWRTSEEFWRIPFMIGFNYAIELRDKALGAPYIRLAAKFPGVPEYIVSWAATLYRKTGQGEEALAFLQGRTYDGDA